MAEFDPRQLLTVDLYIHWKDNQWVHADEVFGLN